LYERTLLHCHRVLHEAMKRAVSRKRIASNPCADVAAPKPKPSTVGVLDEKQTGKLLETAQGTRLHVPILVAVTTGLRLGELLGLAWDDVDLKAGRLSVRRTLQRLKGQGLVLKDFPKTKSGFRAVALPPLTVEALRRHRIQQRQEKMRLHLVWQEHGLVFPNELGEPWGPDSVSHQFGRLADSLGFAITFHSLRHSHATHLLRAGVHMKIASGRLGHSTIAITADLYSEMAPVFWTGR
jgi:integrase